MFGFGKKKETKTEAKGALEHMGYEANTVKNPGKTSRGDNKKQHENEKALQEKKERLIQKLNELRSRMYDNSDFNEYSGRLETSIRNLKRMDNCSDLEAMEAIDMLLIAEINGALSDCDKGSYVGIAESIDNIDTFINDRRNGEAYYKDAEYCKALANRNRLNINIKNADNEREQLERRRAEISKAVREHKVSREVGGRKIDEINDKLDDIDEGVEIYKDRLSSFNKILETIKQQINIDETNKDGDYEDLMDNSIDKRSELSQSRKQDREFIKKMKERRYKPTASDERMEDNYDSLNKTSKYDEDYFNKY